MYPKNKAKSQLRLFILKGGSAKEFAYLHKITPRAVYKWLPDVGLKKHFLTDEEIRLVIEQRKKTYK